MLIFACIKNYIFCFHNYMYYFNLLSLLGLWTVIVYKENFWNRNLLSYFVNSGQIQSQ